MAETSRITSEKTSQQRQHDEEEQDQVERSHAERSYEEPTVHTARRRASLEKEIRAGWQRALGH